MDGQMSNETPYQAPKTFVIRDGKLVEKLPEDSGLRPSLPTMADLIRANLGARGALQFLALMMAHPNERDWWQVLQEMRPALGPPRSD